MLATQQQGAAMDCRQRRGFDHARLWCFVIKSVFAAGVCAAIAACGKPSQQTASEPHPQQAGQGTHPLVTAVRLTAADAAVLAGDQRAAQQQFQAMHKDMMRDMRVPDPSRPIDHEAARTAVRTVPGVRTSAWIDRENLLVMVDSASYRSMQTIDRICVMLEPLGDTLAVVVNLQNVAAKTSEEADGLARNCQLPEGEVAAFRQKKVVDALDPRLRETFKAQQRTRDRQIGQASGNDLSSQK